MASTYRIEIYNLTSQGGARVVGTGWMAGELVNGCRTGRQWDFGADEAAARSWCDKMNAPLVGDDYSDIIQRTAEDRFAAECEEHELNETLEEGLL